MKYAKTPSNLWHRAKRLLRVIVTRLLLIFFGLVLGIAVLEIGIRILHLEKDTFWQPHELYGWAHIPNREGWWFSPEFQVKVKINSKGLREREIPYDKPAGVIRILLLGDSMTEAIQVPLENTFAYLLESRLNQIAGANQFQVINAGVSHYGTDNELLYFQYEGYKYEPDIVILAFLTTNDVSNNSYELGGGSPYFILNAKGELEIKDFPLPTDNSIPNRLRLFLGTNFQSYNFVSRTVRTQIPTVVGFLQSLGIMRKASQASMTNGIPTDFFVYAANYETRWENAWAITQQLILQIKREVEARNARFMVVIFSPQFVHVREQNWQEYLNAFPAMNQLEWDLDKPDRLMVEFLREQQIPFLHTTPYFQAEAKRTSEPLYFPADGHLSPAGHRLAAQLIAEEMLRSNLIAR
jgi:hypothetical protein